MKKTTKIYLEIILRILGLISTLLVFAIVAALIFTSAEKNYFRPCTKDSIYFVIFGMGPVFLVEFPLFCWILTRINFNRLNELFRKPVE